MKLPEFASFNLAFSDIGTSGLVDAVAYGLFVPEIKFPHRVWLKEEDYMIGGYFESYEKRVELRQVYEALSRSDSVFFTNLIGDYFLVCADKRLGKVWILTSPNGKFPCFFAANSKGVFASVDFSSVLKQVGRPVLDIGAAMDYISRSIWPTDQTLVTQIRQIPPGYALVIQPNFPSVFVPLFRENGLTDTDCTPYVSSKDFADDFVSLLGDVITEQVKSTPGLKYGADLSSGFDSTLVCYAAGKVLGKNFTCYSAVSSDTVEDTDPVLVKEFAQRHSLALKFVSEDKVVPFVDDMDLALIERRPSQIFKAQLYRRDELLAGDGVEIQFTGDGGDEAYWTSRDDLWNRFPIHEQYFGAVKKLDLKIDRVLDKKGVDLLYDRGRFAGKNLYYSLFSPSAVTINLDYSDVNRIAGIWQMTPFVDQRMVRLGRRIPRRGNETFSKQDIYGSRKDIFPDSFFRRKGNPTRRFQRFLDERRSWVVGLLKKSELGSKGWIRTKEIANDIEKGDIQKYLEGTALIFLINFLELEYFMRGNDLKLS